MQRLRRTRPSGSKPGTRRSESVYRRRAHAAARAGALSAKTQACDRSPPQDAAIWLPRPQGGSAVAASPGHVHANGGGGRARRRGGAGAAGHQRYIRAGLHRCRLGWCRPSAWAPQCRAACAAPAQPCWLAAQDGGRTDHRGRSLADTTAVMRAAARGAGARCRHRTLPANERCMLRFAIGGRCVRRG